MASFETAFNADKFNASPKHRAIYRRYEIAYTSLDLIAGLGFLVGSVLFFWKATETAAIWLFTIASLFFFLRPLARVSRELELARLPVPEDDPAKQPGAEDTGSTPSHSSASAGARSG